MMKSNKAYLSTLYLLLGICLFSVATLFNGCTNNENVFHPTGDTITDGRLLVKKYCTRCHEPVGPEMLTKDVWKFHTLPSMARYLHISTYMSVDYYKNDNDTSGASLLEWQIIRDYFQKLAPAELPALKEPVPLENDWAGFTLRKPGDDRRITRTTMVSVNPATKKLYTGDFL